MSREIESGHFNYNEKNRVISDRNCDFWTLSIEDQWTKDTTMYKLEDPLPNPDFIPVTVSDPVTLLQIPIHHYLCPSLL